MTGSRCVVDGATRPGAVSAVIRGNRGVGEGRKLSSTPRSDSALLAAHRRGDKGAFAEIVLRHEVRLRGMCWRYVHDAHLVQDLVQETFCRLLETAGRVDSEGFNVSAWMHRIAANLCLDELRRRGRQALSQTRDGDDGAASQHVADGDRWGRPHEAAELRLTRSMIRAAIDRLPARQREVLVMCDVRGMSQAAVSTALALHIGAVEGVLHRARERFKEEYIAIDGTHSEPGECGVLAFTIEYIGLTGLRRDRRTALQRHILRCPRCQKRYGWTLLRAIPDGAARKNGLHSATAACTANVPRDTCAPSAA